MPWLHTIAGFGGFPPRTHIGCRSAGEKAFQTLQMNTNEASVYIQHKAEETRGNLNEAFLFFTPLVGGVAAGKSRFIRNMLIKHETYS